MLKFISKMIAQLKAIMCTLLNLANHSKCSYVSKPCAYIMFSHSKENRIKFIVVFLWNKNACKYQTTDNVPRSSNTSLNHCTLLSSMTESLIFVGDTSLGTLRSHGSTVLHPRGGGNDYSWRAEVTPPPH